MSRSVKKLLDGFLFGLGFSLSMLVVFGVVAVCGTAVLVKTGLGTIAHAWSEGSPLEMVEGVSLVSSSLTRRGDEIAVSAVVTNSTGIKHQRLTASIELSRRDGTLVDFNLGHPLETLEPHSQKDLLFVFAGGEHTNSIEDLMFKLEVFKASEKK